MWWLQNTLFSLQRWLILDNSGVFFENSFKGHEIDRAHKEEFGADFLGVIYLFLLTKNHVVLDFRGGSSKKHVRLFEAEGS